MQRIVVTGASGLLGWHARAAMHAANCAAQFAGRPAPYAIISLDRDQLQDPAVCADLLKNADAVLHFAGVNRASEAEIARANPAIAEALVAGARKAGRPDLHVLYANSTHSRSDSSYGRSKRQAGEILGDYFSRFTQFVLPHIFGEEARPHYNNVTATLIDDVLAGRESQINPDGRVELLHAGAVARMFLGAFAEAQMGEIAPQGFVIAVPQLAETIVGFHKDYCANIVPDLPAPFDVNLFNCYRAATFPQGWPRALDLKSDNRGNLFEAIKSRGTGQVFLSSTKPGITRGNHFHSRKIERFLVLQGAATIRIRRVLHSDVHAFEVSGDAPSFIDMPALHTHSIENTGSDELITLFWTNEFFDPADPDTFADMVIA